MSSDPTPLDDPFEALGVEPRFDLELGNLRKRWLALAARLHPDIAPDPEEAGRTLARASAAHARLTNPESRADALLVRLGGPTKEQCNDLPAGFLMEIMEVREELEDAVAEGDDATIERLREWAAEQRGGYEAELGQMFAALETESVSGPDAEALRAIRERLNAWRYIERMIEQAG